ncbi:S1 family peptidase [Nocardia transvalensis]|uniref:S1 family peptidase n=1 Tax=Nocardia transvalensis TaxID=37333 RepID=UPI001E402758|nr:trypsin-like serine protease [Nocardia transvalensis]
MTNGSPVNDPAVAPWVATLAPLGDDELFLTATCGGALVAPDRVVTAAHCVDQMDPSLLRVHINARLLSRDPGIVRGVRGISALPGYEILPTPATPGSAENGSARDDLAVIVLDAPVDNVAVLPIADHRPEPGQPVTFYAHGNTGKEVAFDDPEYRSDVLHGGDLQVISHSDCAAATPATVDENSVVCAQDFSDSPVTGCWRDSGSPMVSYTDGEPRLVGLFSFGGETADKQCGEPAPLALADPTAFRDWIYGPLPDREPYPANRPAVTRDDRSLHCEAPAWDSEHGGQPSEVSFEWATRKYFADVIPVLTPIPGATTPTLSLADTSELPSDDVVCVVSASNRGGSIQVWSDGVRIG